MKKTIIILLLVIGGLILFWPKSNPPPTPPLTGWGEQENIHPLSIEALRNRQFEKQDLKIERQVRETDKFVSYVVAYNSEGNKLYALMNVPKGGKPEAGWPIVIVNHGYIPPEVYSTENSYINTSAYFANAGFLVLKPDYRGHDKSEGEPTSRVLSRSEYTVDVLNLLATVESIEEVDTVRIYMYGHSMGGTITAQVLEITDKVKAATLWAPAIADYPEEVLHFVRKRNPSEEEVKKIEEEVEAIESEYGTKGLAAIENLGLINGPINLHHATADQSVPYSWGMNLAEKLERMGKTVNFYSYQGDNHDIAGNWSVALSRDVELFLEN